MGEGAQALAHLIDIACQLLVGVKTIFPGHSRIGLLAEFDFILFADKHQVRTSSDGVDGTGNGHKYHHDHDEPVHDLEDTFSPHVIYLSQGYIYQTQLTELSEYQTPLRNLQKCQ